MSILWKLGRSARSRVDKLTPSPKTGIALGLIFAAGAICAPLHVTAAPGPRVDTKDGPVIGFLNTQGVAEFLGIPYAAPPVGNLRWMPPQKHSSWHAPLKATAYANTCAQVVTLGVFAGPPNKKEDCLYLNVFTPNLNSSAKLPVVFWIHGGGNVDGESNDYDGSKLAGKGKAVVVTTNYRLNLFGFFSHPALDAEGHLFGNYGNLDTLAALKWVRSNIRNFGGDPGNITVGGQSAGATDTGIAVVSPLFAGQFQKAIYESSVPINEGLLSVYEARGVAFSVAAGCGSGTDAATAACLRKLTAAQVESFAGTASGNSAYVQGPVVDGKIIPIQPIAAWHSGQFNHMPMMNGRVEDEANFGLANTAYFCNCMPTADGYTTFINTTYTAPNAVPPGLPYPAGTAAAILAKYPIVTTPQQAWDNAVTDMGACATQHVNKILAPQVPYYAYEFDDRTAPFYYPVGSTIPSVPTAFVPGAYHTSDIPYLFGNDPIYHGGPVPPSVAISLNSAQQDLSDQLVYAWTNLAWTGNPNGAMGSNSPWPRFRAGTSNVPNILSEAIPTLTTFTNAQYSANHNCAASGSWPGWDAILPYTYGPAW